MTAQAGTAAAVGVLAVVVLPLALLTALMSLLWSTISPTTATTPGAAGTGTGGAPAAVADIPNAYLALYVAAARTCPGLAWSVLAAVGKIETDHGRSTLPGVHAGANAAGSVGIMQFQPATWAAVTAQHPVPPGGATPPSPYNPHDAIYTAAAYLCSGGAGNPATLNRAIFSYNHSNQYVANVLAQAHRYAATAPTTPDQTIDGPQGTNSASRAGVAAAAITYARGQIGRPYVWGGNGATGFDCSGLTKAAYGAADVTLPRTAEQQFRAGPHLPANEPLQPGDLVFYGSPVITHVALYIGGNQVIQAKDVGTLIEYDALPTSNYAGATRPASTTATTPSGSSFLADPEVSSGNLVVSYQRLRNLIPRCALYLTECYYTVLSTVGFAANSVAFWSWRPKSRFTWPREPQSPLSGDARHVRSRVHLGCPAPPSDSVAAGPTDRGGQQGPGATKGDQIGEIQWPQPSVSVVDRLRVGPVAHTSVRRPFGPHTDPVAGTFVLRSSATSIRHTRAGRGIHRINRRSSVPERQHHASDPTSTRRHTSHPATGTDRGGPRGTARVRARGRARGRARRRRVPDHRGRDAPGRGGFGDRGRGRGQVAIPNPARREGVR